MRTLLIYQTEEASTYMICSIDKALCVGHSPDPEMIVHLDAGSNGNSTLMNVI